jgi:hypothetical protein
MTEKEFRTSPPTTGSTATAGYVESAGVGLKVKLSVIISNRNDVLLLATTVRSCIEEFVPLEKIGVGCEVVICDNSEEEQRKHIYSAIPGGYVKDGRVRILTQDFPCLFTARELAIREAYGDYVVCLDSHMLVGHRMLVDLFDFMERADERVAFAHAPISWVHQHERAARHDRDMTEHELGEWGIAYNRERKMTWKGMPWICRKDFFLGPLRGYGALSQHKLSWGGGDMHIGIKPWLLGYENWAVPTRPGIHLGPLPVSVRGPSREKYRLYSRSGKGTVCSGFLVSCYVLGGEEMMRRNAKILGKRFKQIDPEKEWVRAIDRGKTEKAWLDSAKVMSFEELQERRPWDL